MKIIHVGLNIIQATETNRIVANLDDSNWSYHPYRGFAIRKVSTDESGEFLVEAYRSESNSTSLHTIYIDTIGKNKIKTSISI